MKQYKLNPVELNSIRDILGYLNFSSGNYDPRFWTAWNMLFSFLIENGSTTTWKDAAQLLNDELYKLSRTLEAFSNAERASFYLEKIFQIILPAYRKFHYDTLYHQPDEFLFNSFFIARVSEIALSYEPPWNNEGAIIDDILLHFNDFLGYRPIPVLEGREKHEPNPHEWIAPVPLYRKGVGAAAGPYHDLIEKAIKLLEETDPVLLRDAWFDPEKLEELVLDPRAYDFDHPVNRRPNYNFGTWDPHTIDTDGYFHRFVVHQVTLENILGRVLLANNDSLEIKNSEQDSEADTFFRSQYNRFTESVAGIPQDELLYEAAAVLAGTILMGSGITGDHIQTHDSSVSLATLMPLIASYRDRFYEALLLKVPSSMQERLEKEAKQLFQPFGSARQNLNQRLAKTRADQLQRFHLARTYAKMGYFESAKRQADIISVASARFLCQIDCDFSKIQFLIDQKKIVEAAAMLPTIEDLLHRGIQCGAFPDPWALLGFGAQYSLFPSVDNTIHDHRLDDLIGLLRDIFDVYSCLLKEAAVSGNFDLQSDLSEKMSNLAAWWDQFGSTEVSNVEGFSGQDAWESAVKVASALAAWNQLGTAVGDVAFWRRHVERFNTPKAFVLLGEALLEQNDLVSSMALLMHWLSLANEIPLAENNYSFHAIAFHWMEQLWRGKKSKKASDKQDNSNDKEFLPNDYLNRWALTKKFLDRLEANADEYWNAPTLDIDESMLEESQDLTPLDDSSTSSSDFKYNNFFDSAKKIFQVSITQDSSETQRQKPNTEKTNKVPFPEKLKRDLIDLLPQHKAELNEYFSKNQYIDPNSLLIVQLFKELFREAQYQKNQENVNTDSQTVIEGLEKFGLFNALQSEDDNEFNFADFVLSFLNSVLEDSKKDDDDDEDDDDDDDYVHFSEFNEEDQDGDEYWEETEDFEDDEDNLWDDEEDDEEDDDRGIDPTYKAAYENMTYRDSSEDGNDEEMLEGFSEGIFNLSDDYELTQENDRINDRLAFIFTITKLWKYSAGKSPLLQNQESKEISEEELAETEERIRQWLKQSVIFQRDLNELLLTTARYHVPKPKGTAESLVEYDQHRGTKEILLDRINWTIVEVSDTILFLQAILSDKELVGEEQRWGTKVLQVFSAIFRSDVKKVKALWRSMLDTLEGETLLYIPTSRGGNAHSIVQCRCLQQVVLRLLEYAPRLGLLTETFQLLQTVQKMEQIRPSLPGAITEFDRIFEVATRSITEAITESSKNWRIRENDYKFKSIDEALVSYIEKTLETLLSCWLSHSQHIRISSVESIMNSVHWENIKKFIQKYGSDLFTQHFLNFRNLRAILHQGVATYLKSLIHMEKESKEVEVGELLLDDLLNNRIEMNKAVNYLEVIFECIAENYSEYIDYNSTTTHSDHGEKLYMLLDMLRILIEYERVAWNLRPVYWVHESMIRSERQNASLLLEKSIAQKSQKISLENLRKYFKMSSQYGIWLPSIYERLGERFVRPLQISQMCGLVSTAIQEAREKGPHPAFEQLEKQVEYFAQTSMGVGFEVPEWLNVLQEEVVSSQEATKDRQVGKQDDAFNPPPVFERIRLNRADLERQLDNSEYIYFSE
ncbi:MAG: hypothetical protein Q4C95_07130 [Planctomycetia bacterium]|nr:hypothetical protein [Planctomycetia bacterium]